MSAHQGNARQGHAVGGRPGRRAALGLLVAVISAAVLSLPSAAGASTDLATTYQLDPAHDGYETAPITAPLTKLWSVPLPAQAYTGTVTSQPLIVNGNVYYTANGILYAVRQSTGAPLWSKSMSGTYDVLNIAYDAGQIFALNFGGVLVAIDASTGATNWTITVPGSQFFDYDPVATNGRVYLAGGESGGTMWAINEATGQVIWQQPVENGDGAPAVDGTGIYSTEDCGYDDAFSPLTGGVLWSNRGGCSGGGGATAVLGGGYVFDRDFSSGDLILSEATGQTVGAFAGTIAPAVGGGSAYTVAGGTLAAVTNDGLGVNAWTFAGSATLAMAALRVGNLIFDASTSGTLYAIDAATGTTAWSGNLGSTITSGVGQFDVGGISAGQNTVVVPTDSALVAFAGANAGTGIPTNTIAPALSGSPAVGVPVGVDAGVWTGLPDGYSFQWLRCDPSGSHCAPIAGATGEGYVPVAADLGELLEVSVTATNASGPSTAVLTPASAPVLPGPPANVSPPAITGSPVVGEAVTAAAGNWTNNPTSYAYQWLGCSTSTTCQPISGATSSTLLVPSSAFGDMLEVTVTAVNGAGGSVPATSAPTAAVIEPTTLALTSSSNPATAGSEVTFTATIAPNALGGTVTFTANGQPIPGCASMSVNHAYVAFLCEVYGIAAGSWQIGASYSGDTAYGPSSASLNETVKAASTPRTPSPSPILPPSRSVGHRGATRSHRPDFGLEFLAVRSVATPHVYAFAAANVVCYHASAVGVTTGGATVTLPCGSKLAFASKHLAVHRNYRIRLQAIRYGAKRRIVARGPVYTLTLYMPGDEATWTPLPGLTAHARIQEVRFGAGARGRAIRR